MITLDDIDAGLVAGEFFLEYSPTISLVDGSCLGAEALIRWQRPSGIVPPQEFIPLAENTFLSGLITYWVMETAAAELGDWLRNNVNIHLSINVPPEILGRGALTYIARKTGLLNQAPKIVLEVTERSVPDKLGVESIVGAAHRHGIRVALDDVDLSGANFVVLARCQVAIIKVDKTLIAQLQRGVELPSWLRGFSSLMRATPMEVIVEGVETADQLEILRAAGIKMAQGFFFTLPLRAKPFLEFFEMRRRNSASGNKSDVAPSSYIT